MLTFVRHFFVSILLTAAVLVAVGIGLDWAAVLTTVVLIAVEIAFSFDNAIMNAKILERLGSVWQQLFLTVGVVVAIVGMRLVFPILIVVVSAHLSVSQVINLALHHPEAYSRHLQVAHPSIAAFGGAFLLTLALFFMIEERQVHWLSGLERPLQRFRGKWWLPPVAATAVIALLAWLPANHHPATTLRAGVTGVVAYTVIKLGIDALQRLSGQQSAVRYTGAAAFTAFLYLQILDASFSFDGVIGAFAITSKVVLIVAGLGVGALWVRSLTVFMVRQKTLAGYVYLEHGAHYAILALALALLISLIWNVPDAITGLVGLGLIGASLQASLAARRA